MGTVDRSLAKRRAAEKRVIAAAIAAADAHSRALHGGRRPKRIRGMHLETVTEQALRPLHADAARAVPPGTEYWLLCSIPFDLAFPRFTITWMRLAAPMPGSFDRDTWRFDAANGCFRRGPYVTPEAC